MGGYIALDYSFFNIFATGISCCFLFSARARALIIIDIRYSFRFISKGGGCSNDTKKSVVLLLLIFFILNSCSNHRYNLNLRRLGKRKEVIY